MMSQHSKKELLLAVHPRYLKADKARKTIILDEFVACMVQKLYSTVSLARRFRFKSS